MVGGMFGFFLSIVGSIALVIWTFGKTFFQYPLSSYIMHYGCDIDRCLEIFWMRTTATLVIFSLIASVVYIINSRKVKFHSQKIVLLFFVVLFIIQMSANVLGQKDLNDIVLQNINISIDSPRVIRSGNEIIVRVIVKNLNGDTPIILNSVDILNSKDKIIRTSNENKFINPIKREVERLNKLNNLRYSKSCTPETELEYYETAMEIRNNTFSKGFFLDIHNFDFDPKIGENITIPIRIKFSYDDKNFIIDKFHTIPISEPLPAPPHNSPGWYKGDQHMHTDLAWDGEVPLSQMVSAAKTEDLDWVIFTDHVQTLSSSEWTTGYNGCTNENTPTFKCMYSEELALDAGFCDPEHYLAHPYTDDYLGYIDSSCVTNCFCDDAQTKINEINNEGGMGFIAHPYAGTIYGWETWDVTGYTGLEIINGEWSGDDGSSINMPPYSWRDFLEDETNPDNGFVVGIGNSDAHETNEIGPPRAFTYCYLDSLTTTNIRNAIKNGNCVASTGPFVQFTLDGEIIGSSVDVSSGTNTIDVSANTTGFGNLQWLRIYVNDDEYGNPIPLSGTNYSDSIDLDLDINDKFIRLEVYTTTGDRAYTNPIWIDVTSCTCGSWSEGSCGAGSCSSSQRQSTRSCNPSACAAETKCVYDESCEEEESGGELTECSETGYEFCWEYEAGDCDVSIAVNMYNNVNDIQWGTINDSWDPFVIGTYIFGWKGVDTEQVYYGDGVNETCGIGGCDSGSEVNEIDTMATAYAPNIADREMILGYDDTINYSCWVWNPLDSNFVPNYGSNNPIYVLNCYDDGDCSSNQYCNKTGNWDNWDCVSDKSDGQSCTNSTQCSSGYCDNDGDGLPDDDHCFTPYSLYFDNQETTYCDYSTSLGNLYCDERQSGDDLNLCMGYSYYEDECNSTCDYQDITSIFECSDAGCFCNQPLCDGLTTGNNITTCSSGETYFADKCTSTAGGEDRKDNICRSFDFAGGCTADSECDGIEAGTENCNYDCTIYSLNITYINITDESEQLVNETSPAQISEKIRFHVFVNAIAKYFTNLFNNSQSTEELVFTGNGNITRYLTLPKNSIVVNATLVLEGYS